MVKGKKIDFQKWANIVGILGFVLSVYLALALQILPSLNKEDIVISLPPSCNFDAEQSNFIKFPVSNNLGYEVRISSSLQSYPETLIVINEKLVPNDGILYYGRENNPNYIGYNITFNKKGTYTLTLFITYGKDSIKTANIDCIVA